MVSELLRKNGYYCSNNYKEDYQFEAPKTAWDESGPYAHWRNRDKDQPFFAVVNFTETHESGLFEPYGHRNIETRHYRLGDRDFTWDDGRMSEDEINVHVSKDTEFNIPPYLPDTPKVRRDMWKLYNNIAEMDMQVGAVLKQLEDDGLLDDTIIFFYGDHGGPLPREKRLIYDTGLNAPMIIRLPNKQDSGKIDGQLISFIDFAPTLLSLAGIEPPAYIHGRAFLGQHRAKEERKYVHAAADRFDGFTDVIRAVHGKRFKYIRNYRPDQGYYLPVAYRERIPTMQELLRLRDEGKLNDVQAQWFRKSKPKEELFDCIDDPYELNNLADDPKYKKELEELGSEMDRWLKLIGDQPNLAEKELIAQLWNGEKTQPLTSNPNISNSKGQVTLNCATEGASIGYKLINDGEIPEVWSVYQEPFQIREGEKVMAQAYRIGFKPSEIIELN